MLKEGIIRPSKSPYNSPVLVVPKKGFRLVINYKKQNENTIPDRYLKQDPSVILSNLGKAKYFFYDRLGVWVSPDYNERNRH